MPRGVTLGQMVEDLRAECQFSVNAAQGTSQLPTLKRKLQRTQRMLWLTYDWRYMRVVKDIDVEAGQRYSDLPAGIDWEGVKFVHVSYAQRWLDLTQGVDECQLSASNSDLDLRQDPIQAWDTIDTGASAQLEWWPLPAVDTTVRIRGLRSLKPFIANTDVCDIDSDIIIMFAAAELLEKEAAKKALATAQELLRLEKVALAPSISLNFADGGDRPARQRREINVAYVRT